MFASLGTPQSPNSPSPSYTVHIVGLREAEISPDDRWMTALVLKAPKTVVPTVEVQVWDFRNAALVRNRELETAARVEPGEAEYVRYTRDGSLLAAYAGDGVIHILSANDLQELRKIQLDSLSSAIAGLEISATAHVLAVRRVFGRGGDLRIYDLNNGRELRSWKLASGAYELGLAWRSDGRLLAAAVSDSIPCTRFGGTIYLFDPALEELAGRFRVSFLPGDLVFGTGNNLYIATSTCGGYFANWAPDLRIYDSTTGRQVGRIPGNKLGIRRSIAISEDKKRLLAHADREMTTFEGFEDTLKTSDEEWQVRELPTGKLSFTLPPGQRYLMSTSGNFIVESLSNEVRILSVPTRAN
jgi:hypothetical protein